MPAEGPRQRAWPILGMTVLPLVAITVFLLWIWPRPRGASFFAESGPYLLSLLIGVPFVFRLAGGSKRMILLVVYVVAGFTVLWIYALAVLCGLRGVCL